MSENSNIEAVTAALMGLADAMDFTRHVSGKSVGHEMLDAVAVRISERATKEEGPTGRWAENQGDYGVAKRDIGLPIGRGFGPDPEKPEPGYVPMLSFVLLKGRQKVSSDEAEMVYGNGSENDRKAQWYTLGSTRGAMEHSGAQNQPPRPFYQMVDDDQPEIVRIASEGVKQYIAEKFGGEAE